MVKACLIRIARSVLRGEHWKRRALWPRRLDEPAAQYPASVVKGDRLTGRDGRYRLIQRELDLLGVEPHDLGTR